MAFKPRTKKTTEVKPVLVKAVIETPKTDTGLVAKRDTRTLEQKNIDAFREKSKYVLDLLEKRGVDLYAENRTGGMYLSGRKKDTKFSKVNNNKSEVVDEQKNSFLQKMLNKNK